MGVDIESLSTKAKTGFIDYVNPRLKTFNKPLFLAIVIFVHTMIVCLIMFTISMSDKQTLETQLIVPNTCALYAKIDELKDKDDPRCITGLSALNYGPGVPGTPLASGRTWTTPCYTSPGYEDRWCEDFETQRQSVIDGDGLGECEYCTDNPDGVQDINVVINFQQEVGMGFSAALGAALGYAGMFEFFFTVCYVTIFLKTGVVSMKDGGYLGEWVRTVVKESSKELNKVGDFAGDIGATDVVGKMAPSLVQVVPAN